MMVSSVLTLIGESPAAHGIFDAPAETGRDVFCTVSYTGHREFYEAMAHGLNPTYVFVLKDCAEYQGEKICVFDGKRYRVVRTYITPQQTIELTVEEATVDG